MNGKLSTLSRPVYFVNHKDPNYAEGHVILAPYSDFQTPEGWSRHECEDLGQVDELQKRLTEQEKRKAERDIFREEAVFGAMRQRVRDDLYAKLVSGETSEYEKEFIREYLKLRDEKRGKYRDFFGRRSVILYAREYDIPTGRKDNEEKANLDRLEIKP